MVSFHKKLSLSLRIFSVNVTNPQETSDLDTFTEKIHNGKRFIVQYVNINSLQARNVMRCNNRDYLFHLHLEDLFSEAYLEPN